jgi:hypothetical protein
VSGCPRHAVSANRRWGNHDARRAFGHANTQRAMRVLIAVSCMVSSMRARADDHPIFNYLTQAVGDHWTEIDPEHRISDCSMRTTDYLDSHSYDASHDGWAVIGKWSFTWREVPDGENHCIYLERPERRGLTRQEALVLFAAKALPATGELKQWDPQEGCPDPLRWERMVIPSLPDKFEEGIGYSSSIYMVDFHGDPRLAPLDRIQHDFAREYLQQVESLPYHPLPLEPPPQPGIRTTGGTSVERPLSPPGTNLLGMSFTAHKAGPFVSMSVETTNSIASLPIGSSRVGYAAWLLYLPTGDLLTFDDLFVDPERMRDLLMKKASASLSERWTNFFVRGRTEDERRVQRKRVEDAIASTIRSDVGHRWFVSLDLLNPCRPGFRVTFDSQKPIVSLGERAEVRVAVTGEIADDLRPEYLQAFRSTWVP